MGSYIVQKKWQLLLGSVLIGVLVMGFWPSPDYGFNLPKKVDFNYHIRPILSQNCLVCHGNDPSSREAGLRLDNLEGATAQLKSGGAAIVPGNVKNSLLIRKITSDDPSDQMPPPESKKTLSLREIALLKKWIKQGAKWKDQWAFVPPEMTSLPSSLQNSSPTTVIDHLITESLDEHKLSDARGADRNTLIRRVSYVLTGLPPSPDELSKYLEDESKHAYEKMVDHYLASSSFGERWARHWMDLMRYGESMGHEGDFNISHAWEYRDYLIRAFNQDVPYHTFVKEHLAGDMMPTPRMNPKEDFNESILGTAYLFLGEGKHSPVNIKAEEADKIDNIIDVTSKSFQALTVACARCHDHKFDPIPTADYYSMYGMIESSRLVPKSARQTTSQLEKLQQLKIQKNHLRKEISHLLSSNIRKSTEQEQSENLKDYLDKISPYKVVPVDTSIQVLADFRNDHWDGWFTDGIAFGDGPVSGALSFDKSNEQIDGVMSGFASSRSHAPGLQGVLNSPNFVIEHDSIAIRARGRNSTLRIIIDNFHVIRGPLWDLLEVKLDDPNWKTYTLGVGLAKGHKAYLEFLPGTFQNHTYKIGPTDYIDVAWAAAYSGKHQIRTHTLERSNQDFSNVNSLKAIGDWELGNANSTQAQIVDLLFQQIPASKRGNLNKQHIFNYNQLSHQLYDSTHFIGLMEGEAVHSPVFIKGSSEDLSEEKMPHQFLSSINPGSDKFPQTGSGRLAWAESLIAPDNPLTSRVMVNRVWHHLFGRGIVESVDNFGLQGKLPTHPELLDYLAINFIKDGWSIKKLIKQIVMTKVFQQSTEAVNKNSEIDPNNYFLHHFPVRRLEAEAIRDGILAVSGCLDPQMYGPGVPVHLTEFMTGRGKPRISGPIDSYGRRSLYRTVRRNFIPPMMLAFDMPIPFSTFGKRNTTNVPAQSLTLLNDPFVHEQAHFWANNILASNASTVEDRIRQIFVTAFSREPLQSEIEDAIGFLEIQSQIYDSTLKEMKDDPTLWKDYCHSIFNLKEFIHLL